MPSTWSGESPSPAPILSRFLRHFTLSTDDYDITSKIRRLFGQSTDNYNISMCIIGVATIFYALLLAGCSSNHPALHSIYLMSLSYQDPASAGKVGINQHLSFIFTPLVGNAQLTVRAGYFGLCVSPNNNNWTCSSDTAMLANAFNSSQDPLNLIDISIMFKDNIVFSGLIFISLSLGILCVCIISTFPGWHEEIDERGSERDVKPFPSRPLLYIALFGVTITALFSLISSLWQHTAAVAAVTTAQNMAYGWVKGEVGPAAIGFGWAALAAYILAFIGIFVMVLSIRSLDELVDADEFE